MRISASHNGTVNIRLDRLVRELKDVIEPYGWKVAWQMADGAATALNVMPDGYAECPNCDAPFASILLTDNEGHVPLWYDGGFVSLYAAVIHHTTGAHGCNEAHDEIRVVEDAEPHQLSLTARAYVLDHIQHLPRWSESSFFTAAGGA